jgi:hypothetical protein
MFSLSYDLNGIKDNHLIAFFLVLFLPKENMAVFLALNCEESQFKWFSSRSCVCGREEKT